MWGLDLQEQDFSYLTVFASQVAIALEKARLNLDLQRLAITDPLTGLFNRRGLYELGQREVERARRYARPLSVIMLDIDHFKLVNDRYGHPIGDEVLRVLTERMKKNVREIDILARYGGEEFVILLPEIDLVDARPVADRLRQAIGDQPISTEQGDISITISVGVSQTGCVPYELEALIARADTAMYIAKQQGRNCVALDINSSSALEVIAHE
ncbi:MAG: GGDEF domain-containing protein [Anaerolineales bacterium]